MAVKSMTSAVISQSDKERLQSLFADFLNCKEYRELGSSWLHTSEMMISLCAAYGKFDFSIILEHFSDLMAALKFIGKEKGFMKWQDFMIHYAAYCLLDCPLLNLTVEAVNDYKFMEQQLDRLLFSPYYYSESEKDVWESVKLPEDIQKSFSKDDFSTLQPLFTSGKAEKKLIANIAYASLQEGKWNIFAGLHAQYDLAQYADMEKIFNFWCQKLLTNKLNNHTPGHKTFDLAGEWQTPEKYPLHRMMIEYGRERCIPALYRQGLLSPELIVELWQRNISFDAPLNALYGWEKVSFAAFASYFGGLAEKIDLIPLPRYPQYGEMIFRQNVKSAAFFNQYSAAHPRQTSAINSAAAVKKQKSELTDEHKVRLAGQFWG